MRTCRNVGGYLYSASTGRFKSNVVLTHAHTHARRHNVYTVSKLHTHTHTHTHIYIYIYIYTCVCVRVDVCVYTRVYACTCKRAQTRALAWACIGLLKNFKGLSSAHTINITYMM